MKRGSQWVSLSLLLILLGAVIFAYKVVRLGYPPLPDMESAAWTVQARLQLAPERGAVRASLVLPAQPSGYVVAQENFVSRGFGLTLEEQPLARQAEWAVRRLREPKTLYYRALVIPDTEKHSFASRPPYPELPQLEEPHATALKDLIETVRAESADTETFAAAMLARLNRAALCVCSRAMGRVETHVTQRSGLQGAPPELAERPMMAHIADDLQRSDRSTGKLREHAGPAKAVDQLGTHQGSVGRERVEAACRRQVSPE